MQARLLKSFVKKKVFLRKVTAMEKTAFGCRSSIEKKYRPINFDTVAFSVSEHEISNLVRSVPYIFSSPNLMAHQDNVPKSKLMRFL